MPMMWGYGWPLLLLIGPGMLLGVVLFAAVFGAVLRGLDRSTGPHFPSVPHGGPAGAQQPALLEVLRQRYARGEIATATFEDMARRLLANAPAPCRVLLSRSWNR